MEIRNLITFVTVAEQNSFTKAARLLDYAQSTVSFQIKQLEDELGYLLFERINRRITLTEKGGELLEFARKIRHLTDEFSQVSATDEATSGFLRIVVPDSVCEDMMIGNYVNFHRQYPDISLKFTTANTDDMFRILDSNEADIMLTLDKHVYRKDYVIAQEELVSMHFVTGASAGLPDCPLDLEDVVKYPLILTEKGFGYRRVLDEAMAKHSIDVLPILELGRTDVIISMLEAGVGVSFLPDFVTKKKVLEGKLKYLDVRGIEADVWKQLIYHKNKWLTKGMRILLDYISENEFGKEK